VKLTADFQLVPKSRKCRSILPLPHTPSWRSAKLVKHRELYLLPFYVSSLKDGSFQTKFRIVKKVKGKVVPVLNLIKHYAMKAYGEVDV
jgi:hypothetical protein